MSGPKIKVCPSCGGTGRVTQGGEEQEKVSVACQTCGGTGEVWIYPKSKSTEPGVLSDAGWLLSAGIVGYLKRIDIINLWPFDIIGWVFNPPDEPEAISNFHIILLMILGPVIGYGAALAPLIIFIVVAGGLETLQDPYFQQAYPSGLYAAAFGGICTLVSFGVTKLFGHGRESIFKRLVIGVKLSLLGGLFLSCGIFFAILNPN